MNASHVIVPWTFGTARSTLDLQSTVQAVVVIAPEVHLVLRARQYLARTAE